MGLIRRPVPITASSHAWLLNVVIQLEFVRMRPQTNRVGLRLALVGDKGLDQLLREYIALEQEPVIVLQAGERFFERRRHRWHLLQFLRFEIVDVLVERLTRINLVLYAVETSHGHGSKREVRIARRIRRTELDALCLR